MEGPDNNISSFTKNLYLYIAIIIALGALAVIYFAQQGNTETSLEALSKTSQRFAKALSACKTATFDINGKSYTVSATGATGLPVDDDTTTAVLQYTNHAVRGTVNSDAYNDMICSYDLTDEAIGTRSYVGVLFGAEDGRFFPGPMLLLGPQVTINTMSVSAGIGTIQFTDSTGASIEKRFFLEGDTLTFS
ncbi:MAG TPA: hypothetical protein VJ579_04665 [Candidatus Paceibacterota bacterium]|nr:hypothetical protein [Candidatus Paceibacterota bacterium]